MKLSIGIRRPTRTRTRQFTLMTIADGAGNWHTWYTWYLYVLRLRVYAGHVSTDALIEQQLSQRLFSRILAPKSVVSWFDESTATYCCTACSRRNAKYETHKKSGEISAGWIPIGISPFHPIRSTN